MLITTVLAALVATVAAKKDRTFAVLQHYGKGPLTTCRADPIVSPGGPSAHVHTVMGASNFGLNATGESLRQSKCTTSLPKGDLSAYWFPTLYFQDPETNLLEPVPMFYMNVYYFFDATNDEIKAFPPGLQIVSGNPMLRTAPATTGKAQLDPAKGTIQPAQITCPRSSYDPPSWPKGSDGSMAGIQSKEGEGIGFPFWDCDGLHSPMRVDVHMPSCYDPSAGVTNYRNNMQFPKEVGDGKVDCPEGFIHVPHMFFETYWNTQPFTPRWQHLRGKANPFVFSNGDTTGFSAHADFINGWDTDELQNIIDNCNTGHAGIHKCPGLKLGVNDDRGSCNIECPVDEVIDGKLEKLPGNNPLAGWGRGGGDLPAPAAAPSPSPAPSPNANPQPQPGAGESDAGSDYGYGSGDDSDSSSSSSSTSPPVPAPTLEEKAQIDEPAPVPTTTTTSQQAPAADPTPKVDPTPKAHGTKTVYDTVTVWQTTTLYIDDAAPTPNALDLSGQSEADEIAGFKYVGCYRDSSSRALSGEVLPKLGDVSNTACVEYCASKGFAIAGTEYGGECYCGNSVSPLEKLDESECAMPCKGDEDQTCGDHWALTLYAKDGQLPASGSGAASRRHAPGHHYAHHARHASRRHRR